MLLSDADREWLLETLKRHAAAGTLELGELERRVGQVATASTREEAASAMADLPPLEQQDQRRRRRFKLRRGHGDADAPQPDWHPTGERFRDPSSDRVMRVWVDAAGARHYVADEQDRPS